MHKRYMPGLGVRVWRDIVWYLKQAVNASCDVLAGFGFGLLLVLLPVMAGFMVR